MWELRFRKEEYSLRSGVLKGRELPPWFTDFPELLPGEEFYLVSFWRLNTERQVSQGVLGRIPYSRAIDFAVNSGVAPDMLEAFWRIVSSLDAAYLELQAGEYNKSMQSQKREINRRSKSRRDYGRS